MPVIDATPASPVIAQGLAHILREAGEIALKTFGTALRNWTKGKGSPVSEADIAVDEFLRGPLLRLAPGSAWLSEESEDDRARLDASQLWIVDPIDGTRAYLAGRTDWSISVALVREGRPVAAAVFAPAEQNMYVASAGGGAALNGAPIMADPGTGLAAARVAGPKPYLHRLTTLGTRIAPEPKVHSLALRLARVAAGALDAAFVSDSSHDWDLAAADLLVHEAGGALTTFMGHVPTYNRAHPVHGSLIAAGRARHGALVELVRAHELA